MCDNSLKLLTSEEMCRQCKSLTVDNLIFFYILYSSYCGRLGAYLVLSHGVAMTESSPLGLQMPSFLQSQQHLKRSSCLGSYQQTALSHLRSRGTALSFCHWLVLRVPRATFGLRTSLQTVVKPITITLLLLPLIVQL